jgi:hypothetical protein
MRRLAVGPLLTGLADAWVVAMGRAARHAAGVRDGALGVRGIAVAVQGEGGPRGRGQHPGGEDGGERALHLSVSCSAPTASAASKTEIAKPFVSGTPRS